MWWSELERQAGQMRGLKTLVHPSARIAATAVLDGEIRVDEGVVICHGAYILGPVHLQAGCLVGNNALIRGPATIGAGSRVGFAAEIKNAVIGSGVAIGPQSYVADSVVEDDAYLGAQVRTSNHRLDRQTVKVIVKGQQVDTGLEKLGCLIGARALLGVQTIVLPGRVIAPDSLFEPRFTVSKNLPAGRYRVRQEIQFF
jgi:bifunctional UDP-N-acetylglucosamine pyrophosphorylase/glucosamine-1-phosphate N-acetyltransferase